MDAINTPVKRTYQRKEVHSADMPMSDAGNIDLSLGQQVSHGEPLVHIASETLAQGDFLAQLAFMEEPVTVCIEENSGNDFPETHVPVYVNGKGAEVLLDGRWTEFGWLPIGPQLVTKRKYVEVLARSRSTTIKTVVEDATVPMPRNEVSRKNRANYPLTILHDANPRGRDWLAAVRINHA